MFDQGWADAWERAGGRYYPKLQAAVPFTPVPGPRLLVRAGRRARRAAAPRSPRALVAAAEQLEVSSAARHLLRGRRTLEALSAAGLLTRTGVQFHWDNRGYRSFDDFLGALSSRKRKAIRKERASRGRRRRRPCARCRRRRSRRALGRLLPLLLATSDRKWGSPYLTREFFDRLRRAHGRRGRADAGRAERPADRRRAQPHGRDALYGRNWGCSATCRSCISRLCYYQAIDYAIAHGLARVEAGAQGEHKIQRGYLPVADPLGALDRRCRVPQSHRRFPQARARGHAAEIEALSELSPYRA